MQHTCMSIKVNNFFYLFWLKNCTLYIRHVRPALCHVSCRSFALIIQNYFVTSLVNCRIAPSATREPRRSICNARRCTILDAGYMSRAIKRGKGNGEAGTEV